MQSRLPSDQLCKTTMMLLSNPLAKPIARSPTAVDCDQLDRIALDILYDEADERVSEDAQRHLDQCSRCAELLADLRSIRQTIGHDIAAQLIEPPTDFEPQLLDVARKTHKQVSLPRRVGRWISWAGGYAMRPQTAMAVLLLLMIGSSLFFIRGRRSGDQGDVVRITEQGVPEAQRTDPGLAQNPSMLLPAPDELARAQARRPKVGNIDVARTQVDVLPAPVASAGDVPDAQALDPSVSDDDPNAMKPPAQVTSASIDSTAEPVQEAYTQALALYKAGSFVGAYRAFDAIAIAGGPNAASAALYAAKAVRASSGCVNALPRYESVWVRYGGTAAGREARWETASCARITGDLVRARIIYRELASVDSQRERAEAELAKISSGPLPPAPTASSGALDRPGTAPGSEDREKSGAPSDKQEE